MSNVWFTFVSSACACTFRSWHTPESGNRACQLTCSSLEFVEADCIQVRKIWTVVSKRRETTWRCAQLRTRSFCLVAFFITSDLPPGVQSQIECADSRFNAVGLSLSTGNVRCSNVKSIRLRVGTTDINICIHTQREQIKLLIVWTRARAFKLQTRWILICRAIFGDINVRCISVFAVHAKDKRLRPRAVQWIMLHTWRGSSFPPDSRCVKLPNSSARMAWTQIYSLFFSFDFRPCL